MSRVDTLAIERYLARETLDKEVIDTIRAFVKCRLTSSEETQQTLASVLALADGELDRLRGLRDRDLASALRLANATSEVVTYLLMLWRGRALAPKEMALVTPYLMGNKAALDLLPDPKYKFTTDWVSENEGHWRTYLGPLAGSKGLRILEVGVFEGRSTCWFLGNLMTGAGGQITCVDTFQAHTHQAEYFDFNVAATGSGDRVKKMAGYSQQVLPQLPVGAYDLIYIDGSHFAFDVVQDAVLAWPLLKKGGLLLFDDYELACHLPEWGPILWTKRGVDAFLTIVDGWYEEPYRGYQLLIRKTS